MIANEHEVTRAKGSTDASGSVGNEQDWNTERIENTNREAGERGFVSFIDMEAASERDDRSPRKFTGDERPRMANHRRGWKAGHLGEWDRDGIGETLHQAAKAGAQNDSRYRSRRSHTLPNGVGGTRSSGRTIG